MSRAGWRACVLLLLGGLAAALAGQELGLVRRLADEGRLDEALQALDIQLAEAPEAVATRLLQGSLLVRAGRLDEAEAVFAALAAERPHAPEPRNNLAAIHLLRGDLDTALEWLHEAVEADPVLAAIHRNLGVVERRAAALAYERALGQGGMPAAPAEPLELLDDWRESQAAVAGAPMEPVAGFDAGEVAATIREWAGAWRAGRATEFLAFYAGDFSPPGGQGRERWALERLAGPEARTLAVEAVGARSQGPGRAQARFRLVRRVRGAEERSLAVLDLVRDGDRWRIVAEAFTSE